MKSKKTRAEKYDTKLAINGTFADVIKVSVIPMPKPEPEPKTDIKKKASKKKQMRNIGTGSVIIESSIPGIFYNTFVGVCVLKDSPEIPFLISYKTLDNVLSSVTLIGRDEDKNLKRY